MKLKVTKDVVIVSLCTLLVATTGSLALAAWNNQVVHTRFTAAATKAHADYKAKLQADNNAKLEAQFKAECQKSVDYYNTLTAAQKKGKSAPACQSLEIVQ